MLVLVLIFGVTFFRSPPVTQAANVVIQPDGTTGQDTWVEYFSATNHGSEATMQVYASGGAGINFSFIKFPLTAIPSGATVTSATMTILITSNDFATNNWHLYPVTSSWDENTMTWNNQPAVDNGSPMLVDPGSLMGTRDIDLTSWVQDWVNGTRTNYGIRIGFQSTSPNDTIYIATSEFGMAAYWPKLTVTYTGGSTPTPTPTPSGGTGGTVSTPKPKTSASPGATPTTGATDPATTEDPTPTPFTSNAPQNGIAPAIQIARAQSHSIAQALIADWRENGPPAAKALLGAAAVIAITDTILQSSIFLWQLLRELPSLIYSLWVNLLLFLGIRKRSTPWGRAMNSVTNEPIPLATITLHDQARYGRVAARVLTDKNGRFGFLANPGTYSLWVKKPGFIYPSRLLTKAYHGTAFPLGPEGMIILDLFCDPTSTYSGWRTGLTQMSYWVAMFRIPFLVLGTLIGLIFFIKFTSFINGIILFIYMFAWLRELHQRQFNRHTLQILGPTGEPVPFATLRVIDQATQSITMTRTTDANGEVYILVPRGDYTFSITNPGTQMVTNLDIPLPQGIFIKHKKVTIN